MSVALTSFAPDPQFFIFLLFMAQQLPRNNLFGCFPDLQAQNSTISLFWQMQKTPPSVICLKQFYILQHKLVFFKTPWCIACATLVTEFIQSVVNLVSELKIVLAVIAQTQFVYSFFLYHRYLISSFLLFKYWTSCNSLDLGELLLVTAQNALATVVQHWTNTDVDQLMFLIVKYLCTSN